MRKTSQLLLLVSVVAAISSCVTQKQMTYFREVDTTTAGSAL